MSKDTISRINRVLAEMSEWSSRPLEKVYAAVFIDAIYVKIRDGQVGNRAIYAAIGVDLAGHKDILGIWAGKGAGESSKFWIQVLTELKDRGVEDVFFVVCDGLKGLPDSVGAAWGQAIVQTCVIRLIRNTFKYASKRYWGQIATDLKPIYGAPTREAAWRAFEEFEEKWGKPYRAIAPCGSRPGSSSPRSWTTEAVAESRCDGRSTTTSCGACSAASAGCMRKDGLEDALVPGNAVVALSVDGTTAFSVATDQAAAVALWTFMRLNAVAARCSSLAAFSRPRREKQSMIFFRLPMPGSTVAPRRL